MRSMPALRDLNKLSAFVRVAEHCSFTKAAQELHTTPSVLSKHMSDLENSLGFSLLTRSTHGVALTEAGEGLFRSCLQMLENIDDYVVDTRNLQTGPYGALGVQAPPGYARWVLAPLMTEFVRRYPRIRVRLFADSPRILEDGCDVIIASKKPATPGLTGREIGKVHHVVCAAPAYFDRSGKPEQPAQLRDHNCLVNTLTAPKEWTFQTNGTEFAVEVKGTFSSNNWAVLTQVALDGLGIILAPLYAVKTELASGALIAIFKDVTQSPEKLSAYYSKTKHLPAKITDFIAFLQASASE